jgi:hypothetical protein
MIADDIEAGFAFGLIFAIKQYYFIRARNSLYSCSSSEPGPHYFDSGDSEQWAPPTCLPHESSKRAGKQMVSMTAEAENLTSTCQIV